MGFEQELVLNKEEELPDVYSFVPTNCPCTVSPGLEYRIIRNRTLKISGQRVYSCKSLEPPLTSLCIARKMGNRCRRISKDLQRAWRTVAQEHFKRLQESLTPWKHNIKTRKGDSRSLHNQLGFYFINFLYKYHNSWKVSKGNNHKVFRNEYFTISLVFFQICVLQTLHIFDQKYIKSVLVF